MKKKVTGLCLCIFILGISQGCISKLEVKKATATTPGIRYFLPQPFLQVTPRTDGGVDVEVVYLPDAENEYAVQAESIVGNFTIDINRSAEGFLEIVTFNGDSTGVAKQLITSAGNIKAAEIDAKAAAAKTQKAEAKTVADKESAAVKETEKALKEAELNLEIATRKRSLLESLRPDQGDQAKFDEKILAAKIAEEEAQVRLDTALNALEEKLVDTSAANAPQGGDTPITAPEPMFFRIAMMADEVKLTKAFDQEDRQTWRLPKKEAGLPDLKIAFAEGSSRVLRPDPRTSALSFKIKANRGLVTVVPTSLRDSHDNVLGVSHLYSLQSDGKTVVVDLPNSLKTGEYFVEGQFHVGPKRKSTAKTVEIPVRVER